MRGNSVPMTTRTGPTTLNNGVELPQPDDVHINEILFRPTRQEL